MSCICASEGEADSGCDCAATPVDIAAMATINVAHTHLTAESRADAMGGVSVREKRFVRSPTASTHPEMADRRDYHAQHSRFLSGISRHFHNSRYLRRW